jgi:hypothetical protein
MIVVPHAYIKHTQRNAGLSVCTAAVCSGFRGIVCLVRTRWAPSWASIIDFSPKLTLCSRSPSAHQEIATLLTKSTPKTSLQSTNHNTTSAESKWTLLNAHQLMPRQMPRRHHSGPKTPAISRSPKQQGCITSPVSGLQMGRTQIAS